MNRSLLHTGVGFGYWIRVSLKILTSQGEEIQRQMELVFALRRDYVQGNDKIW